MKQKQKRERERDGRREERGQEKENKIDGKLPENNYYGCVSHSVCQGRLVDPQLKCQAKEWM